ncbi:HNH endonuclease signature motif containing protein [Paenarthrobacter sp. 4246]|uniref:HNH endonuclease n=1 Tax=Paenarthrobacter sp. 4246 TaxID=3156456 RepID=UPI00339426FB
MGRQKFLDDYGLSRSKKYFIELPDGTLVDSKPIISVALGKKLGTEPVRGFVGGAGQAKPKLEKLGFKVIALSESSVPPLSISRRLAGPDLPRVGETYNNRSQVKLAYGGDINAGIIRFPGDDIVNVFSDATGPYADEPPSLVKSFGYRGAGLVGPQRVESVGNARLERARLEGAAVRYWYRPKGEPLSFVSWVVVIGRSWTNGPDIKGVDRPEIEWELRTVHSRSPESWPEDLFEAVDSATEASGDVPSGPEATAHSTYEQLLARVEALTPSASGREVVRVNLARSQAARRAVLLRSEGSCENTRCTGMPADRNRKGQPILDVDHVQDLALGGSDHPSNMVAICPNCHASKTRGDSVRWRREFAKVARTAHLSAVASARSQDEGR